MIFDRSLSRRLSNSAVLTALPGTREAGFAWLTGVRRRDHANTASKHLDVEDPRPWSARRRGPGWRKSLTTAVITSPGRRRRGLPWWADGEHAPVPSWVTSVPAGRR